MASFSALPGFRKISGYENYMKLGPGILMSQNHLSHIIDRVGDTFPELGEVRTRVVNRHPPSTNGLVKETLFIKMTENSTREDRL
jgi:hypothetical protein